MIEPVARPASKYLQTNKIQNYDKFCHADFLSKWVSFTFDRVSGQVNECHCCMPGMHIVVPN